jgi:streptogramin lyase
MRRRLAAHLVTVFLAALTACTTTETVALGTLTVTISSPPGVVPAVTVSGPGSFSRVLSATQTLQGLVPGNYQITANTYRKDQVVVDELYDGTVTGGSASVPGRGTANASVSYALRPGSGKLWIVSQTSRALKGFRNDQLVADYSGNAAVTAAPTLGSDPGFLAFDTEGSAWFTDTMGDATFLQRAKPEMLSGTTTLPFAGLIAMGKGILVHGLGFSAGGDLWYASDSPDYDLFAYGASQVANPMMQQTEPTGAASLSTVARPCGVLFDGEGDLWVSDFTGGKITRFAGTALLSSGGLPIPASPEPILTINIGFPVCAMAISPAGDLWAVGLQSGNSVLVAIAKPDLDLTGFPAIVKRAVLTGAGVASAYALAFDEGGNLWISRHVSNDVVMISQDKLGPSAAPTSPMPSVRISGNEILQPTGIAFYPSP